MTLTEATNRISAHLARFEADPEINPPAGPDGSLRRFIRPLAYQTGGYMGIRYIDFQHGGHMRKTEAERYLAWLDAGNVGKHYAMPKKETS